MLLKKILICTIIGLLISPLNCILCDEYTVYANSVEIPTMVENTDTVTIRAEQTEWRYRVVNGKLQKRLFSITYDKWLTDWQWV